MPSRNAATREKWTIDNAQWTTVSRIFIANCPLSIVHFQVFRVFDALKFGPDATPPSRVGLFSDGASAPIQGNSNPAPLPEQFFKNRKGETLNR
jgi:hypothetical protein